MAWQLIYTSAPRGLFSGQSGFCTVARSSGLRDAVAQRLEQLSSYHHLEVSGASARNPTISAYRILDIRGTKYHVLTRIQPCGLDFTARTNHLAHHLVFAAEELAQLPSPAVILQEWPGWLNSWQGEPRELDLVPAGSFGTLRSPGRSAQAWLQLTGDAGRAAGLLGSQYARGCFLLSPPDGEQQLLELFGETLQLLNPRGLTAPRAWQHTFTTFLQGEDVPSDFQWRGCREGTPGAEQALRRSAPLIPLQSVPVPNDTEAKLARGKLRSPGGAPLPKPPGQLRITREAPGSGWPAAPSSNNWEPWSEPESEEEPVSRSSRWPWVAIAIIILASVSLYSYFSRKHPPTPAQTPATNLVATASDPAIDQPAPSNAIVPAPAEIAKDQLVHKQQDEEKRIRELEVDRQVLDALHWEDTPIFLLVVTNSMGKLIPLEGIGPLTDLFRQLGRTLFTKELDLRYHLSGWNLTNSVPMRSSVHDAEVLTSTEEHGRHTIEFYYSGLSQSEPIRVRSDDQVDFTVLFSTNNLPPTKAQAFKPFRLMVVNGSKPPKPLRLSRTLLNLNAPGWPETFLPPLRKRLEQIHLAGGATNWQLRPFVGTNEANAKYLYEGWGQDMPQFGTELNVAAIKKKLEKECNGLKEACQNLAKDADRLSREAADLDIEINRLTEQADKLNKDARDLETTPARLEKEALMIEREPARLRAEANHCILEANKLPDPLAKRQKLERAKNDREEAQRLEQTGDHIKHANRKRDDAEQMRQEAEKVVPGKRKEETRLRAEADKQSKKAKGERADESQMRKDKERHETRIATLDKRLENMPGSLEQASYYHVGLYAVGPNARMEVIRFGDGPKGGTK